MKTSILFFIISMVLAFNSSAQFFEIGDKWIYETLYYSADVGDYLVKIDSMVVKKDTIIDGFSHFKIVSSQESPCGIFREVEFVREGDDALYRRSVDLESENLFIDFSSQFNYDMTYEAGWLDQVIETTVINEYVGTEVLPSGETVEFQYQKIINNNSWSDEAVYKLSKDLGYYRFGLLFPDIGTNTCDPKIGLTMRCKISGDETIKVTEYDCYEPSIVTSTNEFELEDPVVVYPNPTSGISFIKEGYNAVAVYDITGRAIEFGNTWNQIDLRNSASGIYFIQIQKTDNSRSATSIKISKM